MEVNLTPILSSEGGRLPIDITLPMEARKDDLFDFAAPVQVTGEAVNLGGGIALNLRITAKLCRNCDRCGKEIVQELLVDCEERLEKGTPEQTGESDPDVIYFSGYTVDIDEIIYRSIFMNLPTKSLCREDCRGLCPVCGQDLNEGSCDCDGRAVDPRFDILDQLSDL